MGTSSPAFRVFRGADGVADAYGATVVAFGKFDGVHLGHRALLDRAAAASRRLGLPYGAATFERHPYAYLRGQVPPVLTGLAEKLRLFRRAGVQFVVLFPTDSTVLGVRAEDFAHDVLHARMGARIIVVGENFRFGLGGRGGIVTLRRLVATSGLDGVEVGTVEVAGEPVSATRIRRCLELGDVAAAGELLGRPYEVLGTCTAIGESSASVLVPAARAVPAPGRYAASVQLGRRSADRRSARVEVRAADRSRHPMEVRWSGEVGETVVPGPVRVGFVDVL